MEDCEIFGMPIGAPTPVAAREASVKEIKRLSDKVTPTSLESGETVIVPHWEASRIWNFAMKALMRLEIFDHMVNMSTARVLDGTLQRDS